MSGTTVTVWGNVQADGEILSQSDEFKVDKLGKGLYTVLFKTSFRAMPAVVVTEVWPQESDSDGGNTKDNAILVNIDKDRFRVKTGEKDGKAEDRNFSFIAIGVSS